MLKKFYKKIKGHNYQVFGISADSKRKHQNFIKKFNFPFSLLVDDERKMIDGFGLWGPKQFMGREIEGIYRTTLVVDETGTITHIFDKVTCKIHGEEIIEHLASLPT